MVPVKRKSGAREAEASGEAPALVRLWLARMLVALGGHKRLIQVGRGCLSDDDVAKAVGLEKWIDSRGREFDVKAARADLRRWARTIERKLQDAVAPSPLRENVERLAQQIGLSDVDSRILELVLLLQTYKVLDDVGDWLGQLTERRTAHILSVLLSLPEDEVARSLRPDGNLCQSGLVAVDRAKTSSLSSKLESLSSNFAAQI